ncbi:MAG: O-antigen ligase family protein, partial [Candidatus Omnitrophica bacterium]|nr:O-antigen ligase family protein [Candidatus Omnitrophota bacterium]
MKSKILKFLDPAIEYLIYGLIFLIPFSIAGVGILTAAALVFFLIKQALSPDFSSIKSNKVFFLILLVFFVFMALSLLNSGSLIGKSSRALFLKWGRFPLILWMVMDTFKDSKRILRALWVVAGSSIILVLSVFSQKFFDFEFVCHRPLVGRSVTGPFKNQNDLSAYITGILPIVLSLALWKGKQLLVRPGLFFLIAMLVLSSLWTLCRGGWVGLAAGLISFAFLMNYNRLSKKMFLGLLLATYVVCLPLVIMISFFFQNRAIAERLVIYSASWKMIVEHPFLGKGLGTFMDHCAVYSNNSGTYYAHNCFLQIWAESGIFSLASFLVLAGYVL